MSTRAAIGLQALLLLACPSVNAAPQAAAQRASHQGSARRVAVLPLHATAELSPAAELRLRESLRRNFATQGHVALPLAQIDERLVVLDPACTTASCLAQAARLLGVDLLLGGRIELEGHARVTLGRSATPTRPMTRWSLHLWLYDRERGHTVAAARESSPAQDERELAALGAKLVARLLAEAVAAQTPARLLVSSQPSGARVTVDGMPVGMTPLEYGVTAGQHRVVVELAGYQPSHHVLNVRPGQDVRLAARLAAPRAAPADRRPNISPNTQPATQLDAQPAAQLAVHPDTSFGQRSSSARYTGLHRASRVLRWVLLGVAAASLSAGITLLALHGRQSCERTWSEAECPERYQNLPAGIALTTVGGLAAATSGVLFYLSATPSAQPSSPRANALASAPSAAGWSAPARWLQEVSLKALVHF